MCPPQCSKLPRPRPKAERLFGGKKKAPNYEAVIEKNGKQTGVEMDAYGKIVSRDDEAKEHKEKGRNTTQ